ncbi:MAG TPA: preprotein translocase subunit SecG [Chthonomonadaceae bacterium]|nr:preprotein translocase subunit SecG [Chthonomonadaceae bacterium]
MHTVLHYFYYVLLGLQFLVGIWLITVVTMQESKNEGLTGQIGSTVASSFKGKAGREERLNLMARNTAIVFMVISVLVAIGAGRW